MEPEWAAYSFNYSLVIMYYINMYALELSSSTFIELANKENRKSVLLLKQTKRFRYLH